MAAPHVAGVAALLWQQDMTMPSGFIREALDKCANKYSSKKEYGNGLIDVEYAMKKYDKWKKAYLKGKTIKTEGESENTESVVSFEENEYVEGSWGMDAHDGCISGQLSSMEVAIMKTGAVYPDLDKKMKGLGDYPYWHGGYKRNSNYISNYIFITRMAREVADKSYVIEAKAPGGMNWSSRLDMMATVNSISWSSYLATPSERNKEVFIWGMSIHAATDVFAHSVYGNVMDVVDGYKKWEHLDHAISGNNWRNGKADDINTGNNRFLTAQLLANASMIRFMNGQEGSVEDFKPFGGYLGYDNSENGWKAINLGKYASALSKTVGQSLYKYSITVK